MSTEECNYEIIIETEWLIRREHTRNNSYAMCAFPNLLTYKLFIEWISIKLKTHSVSSSHFMRQSVKIMDIFPQLYISTFCHKRERVNTVL
jgi:hypothetical protein